MTLPQTTMVGGKRYKRISTAFSWRSAQTLAKQERRKMNVTVVIRKDPDRKNYRKSYGVFNRPIPFDPYKRKYRKSRGPYASRIIDGVTWNSVYQAGSAVPNKRYHADLTAKMLRAKGYRAKVISHSDGEVTTWRGPKRKGAKVKTMRFDGKTYYHHSGPYRTRSSLNSALARIRERRYLARPVGRYGKWHIWFRSK